MLLLPTELLTQLSAAFNANIFFLYNQFSQSPFNLCFKAFQSFHLSGSFKRQNKCQTGISWMLSSI